MSLGLCHHVWMAHQLNLTPSTPNQGFLSRASQHTLTVSDLSFWHPRGFGVPSGLHSGAGHWWSCWRGTSSWRPRSRSCWRRCSRSPWPVAGQAARGVEHMNVTWLVSKLMTGDKQSGWAGSQVFWEWDITMAYFMDTLNPVCHCET